MYVAVAKTVPLNNVTAATRACQPPYNAFPFCNTSLSLDARIDDLIARVTAPEVLPAVPLLLTARHYTPATNNNVSSLGIPEYDWGMNAIHGVQSSCVSLPDGSVKCPTTWPNPVNYGMSWNRSLMYDLGRLIGQEARALWLAGATEESGPKNGAPPHMGLDAWSPNINVLRDPRWGRSCESPSESPLINGNMGALYTDGLQTPAGGDARFLQVIVTLKHWDAYSFENKTLANGTELTRYNFNAVVSNFTLSDSYFPAFKAAVVKGGAQGVMCSYNAVNGVPTCASSFLTTVLRGTWGFDGYVTSDSGAVEAIYEQHHYVADAEHAACVAIRDGNTDVCSGQVYNTSLLPAVAAGMCGMGDVNLALRHTFSVRMKAGLFDPIEDQPYWHVGPDMIGTAEATGNSLLASLEGQVLLKTDGTTLPLPTGKRIAVIGPHGNATLALVGNYLGQICPDDHFDCLVSPFLAITGMNVGGTTALAPGCAITGNDDSGFAAAVALATASDVVVLFLGIDGSVEGEMRDRVDIDLPPIQHALAAAVTAVGKPTTLVLFHGGSLDVTAERDNPAIGAILEAGYPGIYGATAVAMSLFGTNEHLGGKLAYTVYPARYVDAIDVTEMEMDVGPGRGYRYYTGTPVFPFGFGLALTSFSLVVDAAPHLAVMDATAVAAAAPPSAPPAASLSFLSTSDALPSTPPSAKRVLAYTVNVTNTGTVTGDEVVQAYFEPLSTPTQPGLKLIRELFDYQRVHLTPGESALVSFSANIDTFVVGDRETGNGDRVSAPGVFDVVLTNGVQLAVRHRVVVEGVQVVAEPFPAH